jgi:hypothetical protein
MFLKHQKKITIGLSFCFMVAIGTYNAVVINSASELSGVKSKFVKRLDEVYGVTTAARAVATETRWLKIEKKSINQKVIIPTVLTKVENEQLEIPTAAVQEDLNLRLVEVANPQKYQQPLSAADFSGELLSNNGVIESLSATLPNGEGLRVSFTEMTGNVFEYEMNGQSFSGMMYQVDQNAYMVTLTNGPLEGTRLKFQGPKSVEEQYERGQYLAEAHQVEIGSFGEELNTEMLVTSQSTLAAEATPSFKF